jgi:hypothetical protein
MAGLSVMKSGEASTVEIWRSLPEKSSVLSIMPPVVGAVRVETSIFFGVCNGDTISPLAIADVTGHGEAAANIWGREKCRFWLTKMKELLP